MKKNVIIFITAESKKTSKAIINLLIKKRLAACVNEIKGVNSTYRWKGRVVVSREILLTVKTKQSLVNKIIAEVKKIHPYEVPEIISVDIKNGNDDYMKWIAEETTDKKIKGKTI